MGITLYERVTLECLRMIVRHSTAERMLGWSKETATEIVDIIGRTADDMVVYSDGIGLGAKTPEDFKRWFEETGARKMPYPAVLIDYLRYCGPLPCEEYWC